MRIFLIVVAFSLASASFAENSAEPVLDLSAPAASPVLEWRSSQDADSGSGGGVLLPPRDEISPSMRQEIMSELAESRQKLVAQGKLAARDATANAGSMIGGVAWPLRQAAGRTDFDYHSIVNFIDEDPTFPNHLLDYNCGSRTYDLASGYNHQGTDISLWPFAWSKMDNSDIEIVAGAAGTIIAKSDGNFDRSCGLNNNQWNAVYVQHADGSVAWYGHMKSGSPTSKAVGATVVAGEYLGTVGSSGSSTGPHLHVELYDAGNNLVDPWLGACNSKSKLVTWAQQLPYYDTSINKMTIGTAAPNFPTCPADETSYETGYAVPGSVTYFTVYARDQRPTDVISVRWYKPDGSLWQSSASGTQTVFYPASYWYWYSTMPTSPTGTWRFEATVAGNTFSKSFDVANAPTAPGGVTASAGVGNATLNFAVSANGGSAVTAYTATCSASGQSTRTGTAAASPITVQNMTAGISYSCSVTATNIAGTSAASNAVAVTPLNGASSASTVYNIPSPSNVDQPFLRFYNTSSSAGQVRATLYDQTGSVLGNPNSILISSLSANAVSVLTAADIANAVGAASWTGRAWMTVQADFAGLRVLNLIRSSLLLSMSCLNSQYALYLPNPSSTEQPFVRLYNPSSTAGAVRASLYDEGGNVLGTPNAVLVASLAPNAVQVLASSDLALAFGVSSWTGKAWMQLSSDFSGLKIMNTLRDSNTNTLADVSCATDTTGTVANIYNIPPVNSTTTALIRIYNTSGSASTITGNLYAESGAILGLANAALGSIPAYGVMTLSQSNIASLFGAGSWSGRAWMQISSSAGGLMALALTKQAANLEMSCLESSGIAFNIPDAGNAQDQPNIRIYNTSSASGTVSGTLYDQSGAVLGTPNTLLISNMPAKSVATFSASALAAKVGISSWTGRPWMQLSSSLSGLKVMDILQDVASGTWSNMSCATN